MNRQTAYKPSHPSPLSALRPVRPNAKRFPELDGARGFFAIMVMLVHLRIAPVYWMNFLMDCFFTMSAFVITLGLLNSRATSRWALLKNFFIRRSARIFPMYYAMLAAVAVLILAIQWMPASMGLHQYSLRELIPYVFYLQYTDTYGMFDEVAAWDMHLRFAVQTWSLAIEEQFYVVWGLLFVLASTRHLKLAIALAFIAVGIWARTSGMFVSLVIVYRLDAFGYGILLALLYDTAARTDNWCRLRSYLRISATVFAATLLINLYVTDVAGTLGIWLSGELRNPQWIWSPISALTAGCCAALVGTLSFGSGSWTMAPLRSKVMRYFGSTSYAIYLIHFPVIDILLHLNRPILRFSHPVNMVITVALVLGLSHIATNFFNKLNDWLVSGVGHSPKAELPPKPLPLTSPTPV